jgi:hypothetical protein
VQIQILSISQIQQPTKVPGKTTPVLDIAFKNLTFQGKVEGKKLFSFGGNASAFKVLQSAESGQVYDIDVKKNDAGYNDWTNAVLSTAGASPTGGSPAPRSINNSSPAPRSNYETPEERAQKQVYIVRQSSLANSISTLTTGAKAPPSPDAVIALAKEFEQYVFGKEPVDVASAFDNLENSGDFDDIPH